MTLLGKAMHFAAAAGVACALAGAATADETKIWWPNAVEKINGDSVDTFDYVPRLDPPTQVWSICVLVPHLKDTWWVGVAAGAMKEAKRQGVKASLFQAGGYSDLGKQLSQFDDCVTSKANAILIAAISEGALRPKIGKARENGVKVIAFGNPITDVPLDSAIFGDYNIDAEVAGKALVEHFKAQGKDSARVINFAGVAGAGWAEQAARGWRNAFKGTKVTLVEDKYGETGKSDQLKLVEDVIQTYDDIDAYVGVAVMAEVAPDLLDQAGLAGKVDVVAFYMSEGVLNGIEDGTVLGCASNPMVVEAAVAMDAAVRLLEGETVPTRMRVPPIWIDKSFVETHDMSKFTPDGWKVTYTVN